MYAVQGRSSTWKTTSKRYILLALFIKLNYYKQNTWLLDIRASRRVCVHMNRWMDERSWWVNYNLDWWLNLNGYLIEQVEDGRIDGRKFMIIRGFQKIWVRLREINFYSTVLYEHVSKSKALHSCEHLNLQTWILLYGEKLRVKKQLIDIADQIVCVMRKRMTDETTDHNTYSS